MRCLLIAASICLFATTAMAAPVAHTASLEPEATYSQRLDTQEAAINDLLAQLSVTALENRAQLASNLVPSLLNRLSDLYSELQGSPNADAVALRRAERLMSTFEERQMNVYLLNSEDYATWLAQQ